MVNLLISSSFSQLVISFIGEIGKPIFHQFFLSSFFSRGPILYVYDQYVTTIPCDNHVGLGPYHTPPSSIGQVAPIGKKSFLVRSIVTIHLISIYSMLTPHNDYDPYAQKKEEESPPRENRRTRHRRVARRIASCRNL